MALNAAAIQYTLPSCAEDTRIFFDILTHDDRQSSYVMARGTGSSWTETSVRAGRYDQLVFPDSASYYLTRNGFAGKRRTVATCRQVNSLMYDLDAHSGNHAQVVPQLIKALTCAFSMGTLPQPNLMVNTGRGVQLYYVMDRSTPYRLRGGEVNERGLKFFHDVEAGLGRRISGVIADISGVDLDESVYDLARVGRIPGSYNAKAGRRAQLVSYSIDYYELSDLKAYCVEGSKAPAGAKRAGRLIKFDRLLVSRLRKVEELQEYRGYDCVGSRENMCFVHYNTATQIYGPEAALQRTRSFNARFKSPLPDSDLLNIKNTVDNVVVEYGHFKGSQGFYPLKAENLIDKLHMTPEEISSVSFFASKRFEERQAAKVATKAKRQNRDQKICKAYGNGLTQKQVALKIGCSERTVASVTKRENVTRGSIKAVQNVMFLEVLAQKAQSANSCHTGCCGEPMRDYLSLFSFSFPLNHCHAALGIACSSVLTSPVNISSKQLDLPFVYEN